MSPKSPRDASESTAGGSGEESGPTVVVIPEDIAALGYEEARDELIAVVARLESGGVPLEDALTMWERGEVLAAHCQRWLDASTPEDGAPAPHDEE